MKAATSQQISVSVAIVSAAVAGMSLVLNWTLTDSYKRETAHALILDECRSIIESGFILHNNGFYLNHYINRLDESDLPTGAVEENATQSLLYLERVRTTLANIEAAAWVIQMSQRDDLLSAKVMTLADEGARYLLWMDRDEFAASTPSLLAAINGVQAECSRVVQSS